jgi:inosine-uridine nucleoside N-ribohydrolase
LNVPYTGSVKALLFLAAGFAFAQERVILDSDCAIFNDDAAAMVMLLQRPEQVDLLGVTLVPGNMWPFAGAEYMGRALDAVKKQGVPMYVGAQMPLVHSFMMSQTEKYDWNEGYRGAFDQDQPTRGKSSKRVSHRNAIEFMTEAIEKTPGDVTILAIGPMTNLAILLRLHPDIAPKIRRLVFMGGAVHTDAMADDHRAAEFNFWFDPEAAQIVLRSAIKEKVMIGLDLCRHAKINKGQFEQIVAAKTPVTELYRADMGKRFAKNPDAQVGIWDCLAAAYVLDSRWVTKSESAYLDVSTTFDKNYGAVTPLDRKMVPDATPVDVLLDLDFEKFFALYKELLTKIP